MTGAAPATAALGAERFESRLATLGRRLVTVPTTLLAALFSALAAPLWVPSLWLSDRLAGSRRSALRCGAFFCLFLHCEAAGIVASFALWVAGVVAPGVHRGRYRDWHFRLQCWWASALWYGSSRIFDFRVEIDGAEALAEAPLLIFPRHASIADTLLPAVFASARHGIHLRHVLKRELLWDPCLDIVGNRLPNYFVRRGSEDSAREVAAVARLASGLGPREGLLLYPEGTRFTEEKRQRVLARLRESAGRERLAKAEALRHVLPPRSGGPLAVLEAAPGVDCVFLAHVGFERITTFRDLWSGDLLGREIRIHCWRVPAREIPTGRGARLAWLDEQWRRMDAWVDAELHRAGSPRRAGPAPEIPEG